MDVVLRDQPLDRGRQRFPRIAAALMVEQDPISKLDLPLAGNAREAVAAAIEWLIAEHHIHRFVGVAASPNEASGAVLRSLGFRREGHFRQSFLCHGEWLDDDYYALLASEWGG